MDVDEAEMDMIRRGDMLGPKLGAKVATALETRQRERDEAVSSAAAARANFHTMQNAANELRKERDEAREALKPFAEAADAYDDPSDEDDAGLAWAHDFTIGSLRRARAALSTKEAEE